MFLDVASSPGEEVENEAGSFLKCALRDRVEAGRAAAKLFLAGAWKAANQEQLDSAAVIPRCWEGSLRKPATTKRRWHAKHMDRASLLRVSIQSRVPHVTAYSHPHVF